MSVSNKTKNQAKPEKHQKKPQQTGNKQLRKKKKRTTKKERGKPKYLNKMERRNALIPTVFQLIKIP